MPNHDQMQTEPKPEPTANATANNAEPGAERRANQTERDGEPGAQQWRSVQEIALLEGLTERAIQKRCQRGYYVARSVEGEKGEVWEIDAGSIKARPNKTTNKSEPTANGSQLKAEPGAERTANRSRSDDERQSIIPLAIFQNADHAQLNHEVELLRVQLDSARAEASREREQSDFLKSQLEDANRNAQELRASLRAALSAMPKQLTAGDAATSPPEASGAPQIASASDAPTGTNAAVKSPATREKRPLWKVVLGVR